MVFYSRVDNWREAINNYELAIENATTSKEETKIYETQAIQKENICNAYVENGKKHNLKAKKSYKKKNIQKAHSEWNNSKDNFETAIELINSGKLDIDYKHLEVKINSIELNLKRLKIEEKCLNADYDLEKAQQLQKTDLSEALKIVYSLFSQYSKLKLEAEKIPEFQELSHSIQTKIINIRKFQIKLQDKLDDLIGITPLTTKVIIDDSESVETDSLKKALSIKREYEFIRGQIRFKVALINNTGNPLTNFKISFDIPKALKWIIHEPLYERNGDSILISKLGIKEKKAVSLYLEPINCMESPINATISFFDARDRPQAIPMNPKMISITCPIFFTREEANLARVKRLQRTLNHRDKKVFPIINPEKSSLIFSTVLSVLGEHDLKLVYKEYSEKDQFGEAWYYGITKVKKNRHVIYVLFDTKNKTIELDISANDEGQITAFLAEIGNGIRQRLLEHNLISYEDRFYDIGISVFSEECPYCRNRIPSELAQKYRDGTSIECTYCNCKLLKN